jgi:hypothetical protein
MTNYDIYLPKDLDLNLDLQTLAQKTLEENNVYLETESDISLEGFMGLEMSGTLAKKIWEQLKWRGVKSVIAPSRYRQAPLLTMNEALHYANLVAEQKKNQDPSDEFGELFYVREDILWHTFRIFSKKLANEKFLPSSWYINIDKIDGHVWNSTQEIMNVTLNTWFY